ncbi:HNH endonuclease [Phenylobacterium deserti]|uniref:HNH nuclease domain-containing protein n=1 Tax=Phenylobacterium deserti TaxID=1914756 RepID=A0A328AC84_9CAUL|nr:HNH endonuclease signature motif containing protein [Phenylobacterium deserti]RAK52097.1 hypothetical protein DJ018_13155 [Phenylobacterium deserti]
MKLFIARELLDGTPRKAMTPARRKRILDAHDHQCAREGCTETMRLEIDHDIPLALGGSEEDGNLIVLCYAHHKDKTRQDIWQISKAKRQRKLIEEPVASKRPIKSNSRLVGRPFPTDLRKKLSGQVVRKEGA